VVVVVVVVVVLVVVMVVVVVCGKEFMHDLYEGNLLSDTAQVRL